MNKYSVKLDFKEKPGQICIGIIEFQDGDDARVKFLRFTKEQLEAFDDADREDIVSRLLASIGIGKLYKKHD